MILDQFCLGGLWVLRFIGFSVFELGFSSFLAMEWLHIPFISSQGFEDKSARGLSI